MPDRQSSPLVILNHPDGRQRAWLYRDEIEIIDFDEITMRVPPWSKLGFGEAILWSVIVKWRYPNTKGENATTLERTSWEEPPLVSERTTL